MQINIGQTLSGNKVVSLAPCGRGRVRKHRGKGLSFSSSRVGEVARSADGGTCVNNTPLPRCAVLSPQGGQRTDRAFPARSVIPQACNAGYSGRSGFTLIELLVVVLIIGILAAIALPQYQKVVVKSHLRFVQILTEDMVRACELYYLEHGSYASSPEDLDISFPSPTHTSIIEDINRTYLYYPWGECQFHDGAGVGCYYKEIAYQRGILSRAECKAYYNNTITNQVCAQDTGEAEPFYHENGGWNAYHYP